MQILAIDHMMVTVPVGAEDEARAFYCTVLGLPEFPKPESLGGRGGLWLQVGTQALHIGVENGVDRRITKAHIAYAVDDLAAWRTRLQHHGVEPMESVPIPGYQRFEFRDPFGNRVELIQAEE